MGKEGLASFFGPEDRVCFINHGLHGFSLKWLTLRPLPIMTHSVMVAPQILVLVV